MYLVRVEPQSFGAPEQAPVSRDLGGGLLRLLLRREPGLDTH